MYFLNFHIDKKAAPLIRSAINFGNQAKSRNVTNSAFDRDLGTFILMVEGFQKHAPNLNKTDALSMLTKARIVTKQFYEIRDSIQSMEVAGIDSLLIKVKYAINALDRLEAMLHIASTRGVDVEKTPDYIKQGISKHSLEAASHSLSKED
jgi:hypothetical protein